MKINYENDIYNDLVQFIYILYILRILLTILIMEQTSVWYLFF